MKTPRHIFRIGLLLCAALHFVIYPLKAQEQSSKESEKQSSIQQALKEYQQSALLALSKADFQQAVASAEQLRDMAEQTENTYYQAYANAYLGQAYLMTNQKDIAKTCLNTALWQASSIQNDTILCSVYNGLGLYAVNIEADYNGSIAYFFKGVEAAQRCSFERIYYILLCNISGVYFLKGDDQGLKYAQECYDYGHVKSDPFLVLWGAMNSARMYYVGKKYEEALKYIKEAEFVLQQNGYTDQTDVFTIYGEILSAVGEQKQAGGYYKKALDNIATAQTSSVAGIYLNYGKWLMAEKRYEEALPLLEKGISVSEESYNKIYIRQLYLALSACYEALHRHDKALEAYKTYHAIAGEAFNEESERAIHQLKIQFDTERKENEAEQARLEVVNKTRKLQFLGALLGFAIVVSIYVYILYLHKNRLYRRIIFQNREAIRREDELKSRLRIIETTAHHETSEKYSASSLKKDRLENIYQQAEYLMREEELFRDTTLTKERLADKLKTNRTYLSQVINEQKGCSVTQYINSFRINEAIRVLSDKGDNTPLKALACDLGFNSLSTFYKLFQESVGMTPSLYRKKAQQFSS